MLPHLSPCVAADLSDSGSESDSDSDDMGMLGLDDSKRRALDVSTTSVGSDGGAGSSAASGPAGTAADNDSSDEDADDDVPNAEDDAVGNEPLDDEVKQQLETLRNFRQQRDNLIGSSAVHVIDDEDEDDDDAVNVVPRADDDSVDEVEVVVAAKDQMAAKYLVPGAPVLTMARSEDPGAVLYRKLQARLDDPYGLQLPVCSASSA